MQVKLKTALVPMAAKNRHKIIEIRGKLSKTVQSILGLNKFVFPVSLGFFPNAYEAITIALGAFLSNFRTAH